MAKRGRLVGTLEGLRVGLSGLSLFVGRAGVIIARVVVCICDSQEGVGMSEFWLRYCILLAAVLRQRRACVASGDYQVLAKCTRVHGVGWRNVGRAGHTFAPGCSHTLTVERSPEPLVGRVAMIIAVVVELVGVVVAFMGGAADQLGLLGHRAERSELVVIEIRNSVEDERRRPGYDPVAQAVGFRGSLAGLRSIGRLRLLGVERHVPPVACWCSTARRPTYRSHVRFQLAADYFPTETRLHLQRVKRRPGDNNKLLTRRLA